MQRKPAKLCKNNHFITSSDLFLRRKFPYSVQQCLFSKFGSCSLHQKEQIAKFVCRPTVKRKTHQWKRREQIHWALGGRAASQTGAARAALLSHKGKEAGRPGAVVSRTSIARRRRQAQPLPPPPTLHFTTSRTSTVLCFGVLIFLSEPMSGQISSVIFLYISILHDIIENKAI